MTSSTRDATGNALPLAVIGAGFSGTMSALHLLRHVPHPILLCERGASFARGLAYGTQEAAHLLNVRAANMSAFPQEPAHFADWLERLGAEADGQVRVTPVGTFASRGLYGRYLSGLLREAVSGPEGALRLRIIPDEVEDLEPHVEGGFTLVLAGGRRHHVAGAIIAVGNLSSEAFDDPRIVANPWQDDPENQPRKPGPVGVIGTGLTMVDIVMQLHASGFAGTVVALSRHGLVPFSHVQTPPWPMPDLSEAERGSPAAMLHRLRREARKAAESGIAWQAVVDSIRPLTEAIWSGWSRAAQASFLRHARAWWDIHRHRMAPPVAEAIRGFAAAGHLDIRAGHVVAVDAEPEFLRLRYRPRGTYAEAEVRVSRLIYAMGPRQPDLSGAGLLARLAARGLVSTDPHGLGLAVDAQLRVRDRSGAPVPGLWALGPIVRGVFWECTAVPDIRSQAAALAQKIVSGLS